MTVLLYFNALDWTKAAFAYSVIYTHTHKAKMSRWVFTALKQVVGSKQWLPQKQDGFNASEMPKRRKTTSEHDKCCWEMCRKCICSWLVNLQENTSKMKQTVHNSCGSASGHVFLYADDGNSFKHGSFRFSPSGHKQASVSSHFCDRTTNRIQWNSKRWELLWLRNVIFIYYKHSWSHRI